MPIRLKVLGGEGRGGAVVEAKQRLEGLDGVVVDAKQLIRLEHEGLVIVHGRDSLPARQDVRVPRLFDRRVSPASVSLHNWRPFDPVV
jgi:hypothetical protein